MYVILGATGHIGSQVVQLLVEKGEEVTGVTHTPQNVEKIQKWGAKGVVVDVKDTVKLTQLFKEGTRLYLLNPPADSTKDTSEEEKKTVTSILDAIRHSSFEKIVAESTVGAQAGDKLGDLEVLYAMEQSLEALDIPTAIIRGAYYMTNWDMALDTAVSEGKIYSFYPADFMLPMVAPKDIAELAVALLTAPLGTHSLDSLFGPKEYSPQDVANAYATALGKPVRVEEIPQSEWSEYLKKGGFSQEAAESMVNMTAVTLHQQYEYPTSPKRGTTTLEEHILQVVQNAPKKLVG